MDCTKTINCKHQTPPAIPIVIYLDSIYILYTVLDYYLVQNFAINWA